MSMTLSLVLLHLSIAIISMSFWLSPPDPSPGKALQSYNHFLFPANFSVKNFVIPFPALSPQALLKSECKGSDFPHHHQTFPQLFFQYFFQACRIHIIIYGTNEPNGTNGVNSGITARRERHCAGERGQAKRQSPKEYKRGGKPRIASAGRRWALSWRRQQAKRLWRGGDSG